MAGTQAGGPRTLGDVDTRNLALTRVLQAAVVNLPIAAALCTVYLLLFGAVWGPLQTWKLVAAGLLLLSLSVSLGEHRPRLGAILRRRGGRGSQTARLRAQWPPWRRVAALTAGVLFCGAGIYQSLGREVDLSLYPLVSGLCLGTSLAVGGILIGVGLPRRRWMRSRAWATPRARASKAGASTPRRLPASGSIAAKMPVPREVGYRGVWGGVGSAPSTPIWVPGSATPAAADDRTVPDARRTAGDSQDTLRAP